MVDVAPAVVSDRGPDRFRHLVEAKQQVLDGELGELRIWLECDLATARGGGASSI